MSDLAVTPLDSADPTCDFRSREPALEKFLCEQAREHARVDFGQTYVARPADAAEAAARGIVGFYTIAMSRVNLTELPDELTRALPSVACPVALIGQLARDQRAPSEWKIGEQLLHDAMSRIISIANAIGCSAIILDALNPGLVTYYKRFGFIELPRRQMPQKMFLPMATVRSLSSA